MRISHHKLQGTKTAYCYILQTVQDWKAPVQSMVRCVCSGSIAWSCSTADTRWDADQPRIITAATAAFYGRWPQEIDGRNINVTDALTLCSGRLHFHCAWANIMGNYLWLWWPTCKAVFVGYFYWNMTMGGYFFCTKVQSVISDACVIIKVQSPSSKWVVRWSKDMRVFETLKGGRL